MEGRQQQFIIHFVYAQGFSVEASDEWPQALILPLLYGQQAGWGTLVSLSPDKIVNK